MKFKIGNLEVETSEALGHADFSKIRLKQPQEIGRKPRSVYFWDCALAPDKNPAKPTYFVVEANLCLTVLRPNGNVNRQATAAAARRMLAATGAANIAALETLLEAKFPPQMVRIPWGDFPFHFGDQFSVQFIAWVGYKDMFLKPTHGPVRDRYVLSYPSSVKFSAVVVSDCLPPIGSGVIIPVRDKTKTTRVRAGRGEPTDFTAEYDRRLRDRLREDPTGTRRLGNRFKAETARRETGYADTLKDAWDDEDW